MSVFLIVALVLMVMVLAAVSVWLYVRGRTFQVEQAEALQRSQASLIEAREEVARINTIIRASASTLNIREITGVLLSTLRKEFPFDEAGLQLLDDDKNGFIYFEAAGYVADVVAEEIRSLPPIFLHTDPPESLVTSVVKERRTVFFPDTRAEDLLPYERRLFVIEPWKSLLMLPMEVLGEVIGCAVFTSHSAPFSISPERLASIERYVRQFAAVLANAQQHFKLQQAQKQIQQQMMRLAEQKAAAEIAALEAEMVELFARIINREQEFEPLLYAMLYQIGYLLPNAEKASVALFDADHHVFRFVALVGYNPADFVEVRLNEEETLERYFRHEEAVAEGIYYLRNFLLRNYETSIGERFGGIPAPECSLTITLHRDNNIAGLIFLDNFTCNDAFSSADVARAAMLREHINAALGKALALKNLERGRAAIEQSYQNLGTLSAIGRNIASTLDLEAILFSLYEHVNRLMDASNFSVGLHVPERNLVRYELAIHKGLRLPTYERSMAEKNFFSVWCIEHGQEIFINDVDAEYEPYITSLEDYKAGQLRIAGEYLQSIMSVPLVVQDSVMGVLVVQTVQKHAYTLYHLDMLRSIASYAATALANAESYREIRRQQRILEDQATEIELTNSTLHETNMRLLELDYEKNEFLGIVAHDLKNPLAGITSLTGMLQRYRERMSASDVDEHLRKIERTAQRMNDIVVNLLTLNAIERGVAPPPTQAILAAEHIGAVIEQYREAATQKRIVLTSDITGDDTTIHAPTERFLSIVDNLISNAVKYSPLGGVVHVRLVRTNGSVRMEIQDNGPGITQEEMPKLFGKFMRLSAKPTGGEYSTGLGLSIVKKLVEAMSGKVWCESEVGHGATFIVEFPYSPLT